MQAGTRYGIFNDATKNSAAFEAGGIPANASVNPRLDAVVARVWNHAQDGSGLRKWRLVYVAGSASSSAALGGTLPTLPATSLLLAEVLVPGSNPASIPTANIRDRRPWVRGAYRHLKKTTGNMTRSTNTPTLLAPTELQDRIECTGKPLRVTLDCDYFTGGANKSIVVDLAIDGTSQGMWTIDTSLGTAGLTNHLHANWLITPTAGSHLIGVTAWSGDNSTLVTINANGLDPCFVGIEELLKNNTSNA